MPANTLSTALNGNSEMDIAPEMAGIIRRVSSSHAIATSPVGNLHSLSLSQSQGKAGSPLARTGTGPSAKPLKPFATEDIKILLLENVNQTGRDILTAQRYQVEALKSSLPEDELINKIRWGSSSPAPLLRSRLLN